MLNSFLFSIGCSTFRVHSYILIPDQVLEELRLKQFEQTMKSLSKKCFSEKQIVLNEDDKTLINFLVGAGLFGDKRTGTTLKVVTAKQDRKSTRLNSSHRSQSRMPSSA